MGYDLLSKYRGQLMGVAMLWVMLFHAYGLKIGIPVLDQIKALGFGGVDVFLLLSGMGQYVSLSKTRGGVTVFCPSIFPHPAGLLAGGGTV